MNRVIQKFNQRANHGIFTIAQLESEQIRLVVLTRRCRWEHGPGQRHLRPAVNKRLFTGFAAGQPRNQMIAVPFTFAHRGLDPAFVALEPPIRIRGQRVDAI